VKLAYKILIDPSDCALIVTETEVRNEPLYHAQQHGGFYAKPLTKRRIPKKEVEPWTESEFRRIMALAGYDYAARRYIIENNPQFKKVP